MSFWITVDGHRIEPINKAFLSEAEKWAIIRDFAKSHGIGQSGVRITRVKNGG